MTFAANIVSCESSWVVEVEDMNQIELNTYIYIFGGPSAMASTKTASNVLLIANAILYFIVIVIASWAINHGIARSYRTASVMSMPAKIFPIYFPFGNSATGFVVIYSLIAGVVGFTTSIAAFLNLSAARWDSPSLHSAAASSLVSWLLTLLAMGVACKEISLGWTDSNLRTLEIILIVLSGTQLFCTGAIHAEV